MRRLAAWSLKNRATVDILIIAWIVGGLYAFFEIRREFFPEISFDSLRIVTILPGATSEDVERLVTDPIEDAVVDLSGIDHVESISNEGRSEIIVFADPDDATIEEVMRDVERAVDLVEDLPDEAEKPQVIENKAMAPILVAAILDSTSGGDAPWETRKRIADNLEERFRGVPGVSQVVVAGLRDREIAVEVDPAKLAARGLGAADVVEALRAADADLPAGLLATREGDILVRTVGRLSAADSIGAVVVRSTPSGVVRVRDVARVRETLADERTRSRIDGRRATILTVMKSKEGDVIAISGRLHEILVEEEKNLPEGLSFSYVQDTSEWVRERMDMAWVNGIQGFVLVFILLAVFLDLPSAIWCSYGIVSALLGSMLILYATGGTLNMLSIFGFILVLGMLDDDAITVVENVARYREMGLPAGEAIVRGAGEVAKPLTASILTTMASLFALALMTGVMGKFMAEIPRPGIFALFATLLEALITIPVHLHMTAHWGRPRIFAPVMAVWDHVRACGDRIMDFARRRHRRILFWTLRHRYLFLGLVTAAFFASAFVGWTVLRFELVASRDAPLFTIEIQAPAGTSLDEMERIAGRVEEKVARLPKEDLQSISTTIGVRQVQRGFEYGREMAQVMVDLQEPNIRTRLSSDITDSLRPELAGIRGAEITIQKMQGGPPVGRPVSVRISGDDWGEIRAFAGEIKAYLATLSGATDIEEDLKEGKGEAVVHPLPDALAMAGGNPMRLATEVRAAVDGVEATTVRMDDEEVEIRVRYPEELRRRTSDLGRIAIPTPAGMAPIANIAEIRPGRGWASVRHYDGRRTVTVSSNLSREGIESREANRLVAERFERAARSRGLGIDLGGEAEETARSLRSLRWAAFIAVTLIAIILVFQFGNFLQPLVVLGTLPLALIGVILTLVVHTLLYKHLGIGIDAPMGLMPLIGMTALLGMVVNDAIVLVDFVNESRTAGAGRWRAIVKSGWLRLRPVTLASATTAAGAMPMAYTSMGSSAFLAPMALVFSYGILFATLLTLLVTPTLLAVVDDFRFGRGAGKRPLGRRHI